MENNVRHGWAWIRTEPKKLIGNKPVQSLISGTDFSQLFFFFLLNANIELMEKVSEKLKFMWALESSVTTNECHRTNQPAVFTSDLVVTSTSACSRKANNRAVVQEDTKRSICSYSQQSLHDNYTRQTCTTISFFTCQAGCQLGALGFHA